jgi:hypothetical protein
MLSEHQKKIADEYEEIVTSMDDSVIIKTALKLAYYMAMLDAALADPMDDPEDQNEALELYYKIAHAEIETFQKLVNEKF